MSGWAMDPWRKPMAHKAKGKKFQKKHAATIKASKPKKNGKDNG